MDVKQHCNFKVRHCSPTDHLLSATSSGPPPWWLHGPPNMVFLTRRASVNFDSLVTLTEPDKATFRPTGNSRAVQNSLRLVYFSTQSFHQKASEINDLTVHSDFDILLMPEGWLCASDDEAYISEMTLRWQPLPLVPTHRPQGWRHWSHVHVRYV